MTLENPTPREMLLARYEAGLNDDPNLGHRITAIRNGEPLSPDAILLLGGPGAIIESQKTNLARIAGVIGTAFGTDNPPNWRRCQSRLDDSDHLSDWERGEGVRGFLSIALSAEDEQLIEDMAVLERRLVRAGR